MAVAILSLKSRVRLETRFAPFRKLMSSPQMVTVSLVSFVPLLHLHGVSRQQEEQSSSSQHVESEVLLTEICGVRTTPSRTRIFLEAKRGGVSIDDTFMVVVTRSGLTRGGGALCEMYCTRFPYNPFNVSTTDFFAIINCLLVMIDFRKCFAKYLSDFYSGS